MRIIRLTGLGLLILIFFLALGPVEMIHLTLGSTVSPSILVYSDELEGEHLEDRPPLVALRNLGYSYTAVGNNASFLSLLNTGGPWDLVLYNEELFDPSKSIYDALNVYLNSGGRAIITMWKMGAYSSNPLWETLGVSYVDDLSFDGEGTIYLWDSSHSIFDSPNVIPNPLTISDTESFGVDGIFVKALSGATAVAGHSATPHDDEALIVVRDDGKTIFNGVLTGCMNLDRDGDGKTEAVELWENEIKFIIKYERAASFALSGLTVDPSSIGEGGNVTISVDVANTGEQSGSHTVTLRIDGEVEDDKTITLNSDKTETVSFEVSTAQQGTFSVDVNGLSGSYTVTKPIRGIIGFPLELIILGLVGVFVLWLAHASKFWVVVALIIFVANFIGLFRILESAIFGVSATVVYVWWNTSKQKKESEVGDTP